MPLFGEAVSPFDEAIEKVTAETLTNENWALMMDISDRVSSQGSKGAKQCLLSIKKRLNHRDPHVVLFALSLLDCLWNNSSILFRREVSSNEFIHELSYRATSSNRLVGEKARNLIKKWSEQECKKDPSLSLVESLYKDLLEEGYSFEPFDHARKPKAMVSNDPSIVSTEQEEADIAKELVRGGKPGLFPASFVTLDLSEEPERSNVTQPEPVVDKQAQIDEEVLKKCIDLLEQCDPTGTVPDDPELAYFEQMSMAQTSLVDQKLAQIDKQHNMLAHVDIAIRDVLAQYDNAVQQTHYQHPPELHDMPLNGQPQQNVYPPNNFHPQ